MPPQMEPADIDQRITTAVAAALAARGPPANPVQAAAVNNVAVKLPEFWVADPDMWFMQAEAAFRTARINQSRTKFDHVLMHERLCTKLLAIYGKTRWQRAFALLDHPEYT